MKRNYLILFLSVFFIQNFVLSQDDSLILHNSEMDYDEIQEIVLKEDSKSPFRRKGFEKGLVFNNDIGLSLFHQSFRTTIAYQFGNGFELGLGVGAYNNRLTLPLFNTDETDINITGAPVFLSSKIFLANFLDGFIKPYAKSMVGFYKLNETNEVESIKGSGYFFENGIGVQFELNDRELVSIDVSQFNLKTKGSNSNSDLDLEYRYDIWFHDVILNLSYTRRLFR